MTERLNVQIKTVLRDSEHGYVPKTAVELTTENGKVVIPCVDSQANAITQDLLRFIQKYMDTTKMELTLGDQIPSQVIYTC